MIVQRLHGLDALRGIALLLGVVLHASMSFFPEQQIWIVADSSRSPVLSVLFYVLHTFRMLLFFVLAGIFARLLLGRLGLWQFALNRAKHILLPLVLAWFPVFLSIVAILIWNATIANGGTPPPAQPTPPLSLENFPLAHLWFLYVLLLIYVAALVLRVVVLRLGLATVLDTFARVALGWGGIFLLALPTTAALYFHPNWLAWFGIPTPDMSLIPNMAALLSYGTAFTFGWLLQRQTNWQQILVQRFGFYLLVGLVSTVSSLSLLGVVPVLLPVQGGTDKLLYAALYALSAWGWTLGLLGLSLRFLAQPSPMWRYVADASYWVYLVHLPLVMAAQTLVARQDWSWFFKFPLVLLAVLLIAFSSYHLLVRFSFLGVLLNGSRRAKASS